MECKSELLRTPSIKGNINLCMQRKMCEKVRLFSINEEKLENADNDML